MSRKLHILGRTGLLLGLCCYAIFAEDRFVIYTTGDIVQIAQRHGLTVVRSLTGSGNGHHVLSSSGPNSLDTLASLAADPDVAAADKDGPVLLPGQRSGAAVHPAGA